MTLPLRWRLLVLAGLAPVVLALGTYVYLSRVVSAQVRSDIDDSLNRAALVVERQLMERLQAQAVAARVIARDPTFFAAVALPGGAADASVRATVQGVALRFQKLTQAGVFEVWDRRGRVLATVGAAASSAVDREQLMKGASAGREFRGLLAAPGAQWQVALVPVHADGVLVGALLLGSAIDASLARELHLLTRGEVTFAAGDAVTASSLAHPDDALAALRRAPLLATAAPFEAPGRSDTWVTLGRPLPGTDPAQRESFVIQRSLVDEMAFLRRAQQSLLMLALVAILITAALSMFTAERITRPILALVRGAAAMERGDYDTPIEAGSRDEVGYLAMRFREMRARERGYVTSLEEVARVKSEFIALTSHQLRTPIAVIKGYHELFEQGTLGELTPPQRKALSAMQESIEGLVQLTEDATGMAQIEGERLILDRASHDVASLVDEAIDLALRNATGRRVTVERDVPSDAPPMYVDGPRIVQALANLVRNGVRFTEDGGRVDVKVQTEANGCVIAVTDTGVGMTPEQQQRFLARAFVVRDVMHHHSSSRLEFGSAGLGLGLAIASGIVDAHGGSLAVESTPGVGTTVALRIPRLALVEPVTPVHGTARRLGEGEEQAHEAA